MKIKEVPMGSKIKIVDDMCITTKNLIGRVTEKIDSETYVFVSDVGKPYLHDCRGKCENYHGWFLHSSTRVILIEDKKKGGGILKEGMIIHCKNIDERIGFKKLVKQEMGIDGDICSEGYKRYGEKVCYRIGADEIHYGTKGCAYKENEVIEFSSLVKGLSKNNKIETDVLYRLPSYVDSDVKLVGYKGNETRVELKSGHTGVAKCSEGDLFDREIGYKIAYNRAKIRELNDELTNRALLLEQLVEGE